MLLPKYSHKQTGMSMLEVVVAMLIVGLGMAVSINMLQTSVRYNEEAELRAIALGHIEQIADHMRINRFAAINGQYNYPATPVTVENADTWQAPNQPIDPCPGGGCTRVQLAESSADTDLFEWGADLRQSLPEGAANIELVRQATNNVLGDQFRITVFWRYMRESDKDTQDIDDFSALSMLVTL